MDLFENRVPPGVDEAAYVKASWLAAVVEGKAIVAPRRRGQGD
jgi:aconitate hydratase 2/2-methylisocitrate dehydratase